MKLSYPWLVFVCALVTRAVGNDSELSTAVRSSYEQTLSFRSSVRDATAHDGGRYAEIIRALSIAGYKLEPTSEREKFTIISPDTQTPQPAIGIRLFPTEATEQQMREYACQINAASSVNFKLRLMVFDYSRFPPTREIIKTNAARGDELISGNDLNRRVVQALIELPDIKSVSPRPVTVETEETTRLRALINQLEASRKITAVREAELLKQGNLTPDVLRRRAVLWEELAGKLEEAIEDLQREIRGENNR